MAFNSPLSSVSSCASSPFSSPESAAELELLDMPMFFPGETSIYQQLLDIDTSSEMVQPQQQVYQKQQPLFDYQMAQAGVYTPPTSPSAPAYQKYSGVDGPDLGTLFYGVQPLTIQTGNHNAPSLSSSCSSSLGGSPFAESPLMAAVSTDFDLFPTSGATPSQPQKMMNMAANNSGFPSAPVMAPSSGGYQHQQQHHQMTPPMNQMDLERESASSLFRNDISHQTGYSDQTMTTELSMLCKCPGKFPCGEQITDAPVELSSSSSLSNSPLQDIPEDENSESDSESEEEEDEEKDPSYNYSRTGRNTFRARPKSMTISTGPYDSAYSRSRESSVSSSVSPIRQDRRRSSSGSYGGGHDHQVLLEPEMVPEIKDIHVCPVCQRRFTRPFNLRSHLMTHTTARPFPCDECHWKFTRQHDLQRHRRAKHPQSFNASNPKKDAAAAKAASVV
ncbi:hypothetical protein EMPS_02245 [Entomortierella parvispora]|uniref:C2H2-type domain-containing protein n=1 Tax=Entomortierella parvispora TaxID=205924 RepID=A0A9P3LTA7_9FUNG|nr:hypothetical protein EMPS_02245 [Entomortierella parvispora]